MNQATLTINLPTQRRIRVTALAIIRRGNHIFVAEGYDVEKGKKTFRPRGGGIEYGERGEAAVVREMLEEAGLQIKNVRYLATCENIFTNLGEVEHEIALLYEADFADPAIYKTDVFDCIEDDITAFTAIWKDINEFGLDKDGPLYPEKLLDLLQTREIGE